METLISFLNTLRAREFFSSWIQATRFDRTERRSEAFSKMGKNQNAVRLGRKGGKVRSEKKTLANRENAKQSWSEEARAKRKHALQKVCMASP